MIDIIIRTQGEIQVENLAHRNVRLREKLTPTGATLRIVRIADPDRLTSEDYRLQEPEETETFWWFPEEEAALRWCAMRARELLREGILLHDMPVKVYRLDPRLNTHTMPEKLEW